MNKYIIIAFGFLAFWFYEASGGADFEPGDNKLVVFVAPEPRAPAAAPVQTASSAVVERATQALTSPEPQPSAAAPQVAPVVAEAITPEDPTIAEDAQEDVTRVALDLGSVSFPLIETSATASLTDESLNVELIQDATTAEVVAETLAAAPTPDFRFVDGDRVNMRGGPGTEFAVVAQLLRDDMVEVISDNGAGWLNLRSTSTGQEGWMADWLVSASN